MVLQRAGQIAASMMKCSSVAALSHLSSSASVSGRPSTLVLVRQVEMASIGAGPATAEAGTISPEAVWAARMTPKRGTVVPGHTRRP